MKINFAIFISCFYFFSCINSESESVSIEKISTINNSIDSACLLCEIEVRMSELNFDLSTQKNTNKYPEKIQRLTDAFDSISSIQKSLMIQFDNKVENAVEVCADKYDLLFVKDKTIRDSLFMCFYTWSELARFPICDTSDGYVPPIVNGLYQVKRKGQLIELTKEEYDRFISRAVSNTNSLLEYVREKKIKYASALTGLSMEKIDNALLYVLKIRSRYMLKASMMSQLLFKDEEYQMLLKEQDNLLR